MLKSKLDWESAAGILRTLDNVLILTHVRPDGDALGSALGLGTWMRDNGKHAQIFLPEAVPDKYAGWVHQTEHCTELPPGGLGNFDASIVLDCARTERIATGGADLFAPGAPQILNIDHHADSNVPAEQNFVVPDAAATCEVLAGLVRMLGGKVSPLAATYFLMGMSTDTGSFRFANTKPETLRTAAYLLEQGADLNGIARHVYFSKSRNQQLFEAEMIQHCSQVALDGRYAWAALPEELFQKYSFSMRDGEMLIEYLRELQGVVIAALLYPVPGGVKFSLRSKDPRISVGSIARKSGGGGHELAAGATIAGCTLREAEEFLKKEVSALL